MKAEELRIGNLIQSPPGWIGTVERITGTEFVALWDGKEHYSFGTDICEPIPITPEWLERMGFESTNIGHDDSSFWIDFESVKNDSFSSEYAKYIVISWHKLAGTALSFDTKMIYLPDIKYVHQLQNLYHALTGKELEIK